MGLQPNAARGLLSNLSDQMEQFVVSGRQPVLVVPAEIRRPVRDFLARHLGMLTVLSHREIRPATALRRSVRWGCKRRRDRLADESTDLHSDDHQGCPAAGPRAARAGRSDPRDTTEGDGSRTWHEVSVAPAGAKPEAVKPLFEEPKPVNGRYGPKAYARQMDDAKAATSAPKTTLTPAPAIDDELKALRHEIRRVASLHQPQVDPVDQALRTFGRSFERGPRRDPRPPSGAPERDPGADRDGV